MNSSGGGTGVTGGSANQSKPKFEVSKLKEIPYTVIHDKQLPHQDLLYKLIIIGDTGVGKSCLLARIMDNDFRIEHQVTIGVEFGAFITQIHDKVVKLQIWDTAGQESFRSITRIFYRGAHCVFLTYDITREETFSNIVEWLKEVRQHANQDILIYLIGNRSDLEDDREISREKAVQFCRDYGIEKFFETSAKTGDCVEEVFSLASRELYSQHLEVVKQEELQKQNLTQGSQGQQKKKQGQKLKASQATSGASTTAGSQTKSSKGGCCGGGGGSKKKQQSQS